LDELGFVATDRLASWFSHHLSNFDYKWKWATWSAVLTARPTSMQYVFVRFTLEKLVRLSYYDRVAPTLPEEFKTMLPENVRPNFKFADSDDDAAEMAGRVTEQIQSRGSAEEIKQSLGAADNDELDTVQREVLLQSLLQVGSRSLSHMLTVVEKYLSLFQLLLPKNGDKTSANMFILDQLYSFWRSSMLHFEFAVERLVNYRILMPKHVIQWIFERADEQLCGIDASFYEVVAHLMGRGIILRTIQQSSMMPSIAAVKMNGQPEERIAATVNNLQAEYEETLALAVEKLASLKEQLVASEEMLFVVHKFTCALVKEIATCYPVDCGKISGGVLAAVGRKTSNEIRVILGELSLGSYP
jgi:nuclear cap-binding protein subunit 1